MKKLIKISACVLVICLLFSSCSGAKKIGDLTIVQAFGIDKENSKTKISLQYLDLNLNTSSAQEAQGGITATSAGSGKNISEAVYASSKKLSNEVYFSQNKIVVFGYDYAENGIGKALEYLLESRDSRPDVIAAVSKTSAMDIIKSPENKAKIPADNISNLLKLGERNGNGSAVTVCDLLNLYNDKTSDVWMPVLKAEKKGVSCGETAVFSNEKLVKILSEKQTLGFLFAKDKIRGGIISVNSPAFNNASLRIIKAKTVKSVKTKGSDVFFDINITLELKINESNKTLSKALTDKDFSELEKSCEKEISLVTKNAVETCFNAKSDPFMLGRYVYMKNPRLYKSLKSNWREELNNTFINVSVNAKLQRVG